MKKLILSAIAVLIAVTGMWHLDSGGIVVDNAVTSYQSTSVSEEVFTI